MATEGVVLFTDAEVKQRVQEGLAKVIKKVLKRADPRSARSTAGENAFDPRKVGRCTRLAVRGRGGRLTAIRRTAPTRRPGPGFCGRRVRQGGRISQDSKPGARWLPDTSHREPHGTLSLTGTAWPRTTSMW